MPTDPEAPTRLDLPVWLAWLDGAGRNAAGPALLDVCRTAIKQALAAETALGNLLAIIFRDGGQRAHELGKGAVDEAHQVWARLIERCTHIEREAARICVEKNGLATDVSALRLELERHAITCGWTREDDLNQNDLGGDVSPRRLHRKLEDLLARALVPDLTPHERAQRLSVAWRSWMGSGGWGVGTRMVLASHMERVIEAAEAGLRKRVLELEAALSAEKQAHMDARQRYHEQHGGDCADW